MWMQSYAAPVFVTLMLGLVGVGVVAGFKSENAGTKESQEPAAGKRPSRA